MYTVELKDAKTQIIIKERNFNNYDDAVSMVIGLAKKWSLRKSKDCFNIYENDDICLNITKK